jgi:predicted anti-sigma-YlaC factor YlaD
MRAGISPLVCDRVRGQVSVVLDGELSQLEQRMVASHLARCADCRSFEESVREFTLQMRSAPLESPRVPVVVRRARRAVLSTANVSVAAMLAVAVLGVVSQLGSPGAQSSTVGPRLASANLFSAGWQPERELAQLDAAVSLERPGPTPAI